MLELVMCTCEECRAETYVRSNAYRLLIEVQQNTAESLGISGLLPITTPRDSLEGLMVVPTKWQEAKVRPCPP
jgi:hypothetical protein